MPKPSRKRFFRGVRVLLDCGHEKIQSTSMFRLDARRLNCLIGSMKRGGTWCEPCGAKCLPLKYKGTTRLDDIGH